MNRINYRKIIWNDNGVVITLIYGIEIIEGENLWPVNIGCRPYFHRICKYIGER